MTVWNLGDACAIVYPMTDIALPRNQSAVTRWLGFAALCAGMFMAVLDIQIVITSLTVIEEALGIGADRMSWVQTAYLIAEVIAIPITGLLTRVFSLRWLVAGAITIFTLASIGCALSTGFDMLIAFRVLQGFAGGVLIPLVFSAIFLLFRPGPEQTIATTLGGMLAVLAPAVGPITGGLLTENFSWHWLFLINVVPGIITVAVGPDLPAARDDAVRAAAPARFRLAALHRAGAGGARDRPQGSARPRLAVAHGDGPLRRLRPPACCSPS